ncbi:lasso peptide biosynthesis PqqD family chaperone [Saccharopolyspora karakumensis]|uniref:Lasso peptide biosynthesis PqqD family chaperone n=2 Tax=Saccharopolyspora TaxID=1835 RepID=A0A4R4W015_9PSEU|nr:MULTISPECIES: lasso peptide biosynthesis PqqD family chaperone [Saccharopolyspora]TDD08604.1 lasso peptide biosynthesis PqqD family chaperone [Saccharopolyspora terrae]TDD91268.1 lasso peptide biosynthesis PqqD family chaperone [Saccharopolyspora karakumensis]
MQLSTHVSTTETEYGTVLLDERSGQYWQLNPTGALVARTLLSGGGEEDAITALAAEFDVDRDQAARDVAALLSELHDCGLVRP